MRVIYPIYLNNKHGFSLLYISAVALLFCGCHEISENCGNYVLRDPVTKGCLPSTDPNRTMYTVTGYGEFSDGIYAAYAAG
jgi:hypothetical protein